MERFVALIILIILLPLFIIIGLLSVLFNGFPLFFIQERVGINRTIFKIYKLRTMKYNKITSFGKYLRKTGLDEIPQLLNIIKGEMTFIGPRPLTKLDITRLGWNSSDYDIRWNVLPGITGLSQLSPICSKENTWKLDKQYCQEKNFIFDSKIILKTIIKIVKRETENR